MAKKNILINVSPPASLGWIAYNWRKQNGGLLPKTLEDWIRNTASYCDYINQNIFSLN